MIANTPRLAGIVALLVLALGCGTGRAATFHVRYPFQGGSDGESPLFSNLVEDKDGDLYGTTAVGGGEACGCGVVFTLPKRERESVLYRFTGGADGAFPYAGLEKGPDGNFYGVTTEGGGNGCLGRGCGTIFKVTPDGVETVLYRFGGDSDGLYPATRLHSDKNGDLFGTTQFGGDATCQCGTVFELMPNGTKTILHAFKGGRDGAGPQSPLTADGQGNLFGSTSLGGRGSCGTQGCGTIFEIAEDGSVRVVHEFLGDDGNSPLGPMVMDADRNLYGAATGGGLQGYGVIFKLSGRRISSLHDFAGTDGKFPSSGVAADGHGNLYGTTNQGGELTCDCGVIFKTDEEGDAFNVLYTFASRPGHDGEWDAADAMHIDRRGHIYGMAAEGGKRCHKGCVFEVQP